MHDAGPTLMGLGRAAGEDRAVEAAREAMSSPLLEARIDGAKGILFDIAGSSSLRLAEVTRAADTIRAVADPDANVIFGASFDDTLGDEVRLTLIGTGLPGGPAVQAERPVTERRDLRVRPLQADAPVAERRAAPAPVVKPPEPVSKPAPEPATEPVSRPEPVEDVAADEIELGEPPEDLEIPSFIRRRRAAGNGAGRR
jgi:cell division protein FtsZ